MKKILCLLLVFVVCLFGINAVNAQVVSMNFKESIEDEIIYFQEYDDYKDFVKRLKAADLSDYKPGESKVKVHIFRSRSCTHCLDAITHFAELYKDYGDKFDLITYDASNSDNNELMEKVGDVLDVDTSGVPVIVIGETAFSGYGESMDSEINKLINENYEDEDYVDAVTEIMNGTYDKANEKEKTNKIVSYIVLGIAAVIVVAIIVARNNTTYYDDDEEEKVALEEKEEPVKVEKTTKTTTKKTTAKKATAKKTTKKTTKK